LSAFSYSRDARQRAARNVCLYKVLKHTKTVLQTSPFDARCCHMDTAWTKHPAPDLVKQSFVIFDIRELWHSALGVRVHGCQKLQMTA